MKLHGRAQVSGFSDTRPRVLVVTRGELIPRHGPDRCALLASDAAPPDGACLLTVGEPPVVSRPCMHIAVGQELSYLDEGDIIRVAPASGSVNVLYRRRSPHNTVLVTEQCNSNCIMCSQPPKDHDDGYLIDEILDAIPIMDPTTAELGLSGGEPTLNFEGLEAILRSIRENLPTTAVHILSNGRRFAWRTLAERLAAVGIADLMVGVPLYSDVPASHDFVVQADGAFDETIRGLIHLARHEVPIELRVVIHKQTYRRLPELAEFIGWNLPFVHHVALMGLEMMGYVRMNLDALWIDPVDYQGELTRCVEILDRHRVRAHIYNHQLCVLDQSLWPYAVQSISDWKNIYWPECEGCAARGRCGGFFASSRLMRSRGIAPIPAEIYSGEIPIPQRPAIV